MTLVPELQEFIDSVESGELPASKEIHALIAHVKNCFATEDIYVDTVQLQKYLGIVKYFEWEEGILPWQKFILTLWTCTYWRHCPADPDLDGEPRWPDLMVLVGRGAGKSGFIGLSSVCLASQYNGIREYDVDIVANTESQAMVPVNDIRNAFERPKVEEKLRGKYFEWTKEVITALLTGSEIKARTNNPKSKDGLRSGAVLFDEIHAYQNYDNIDVFTTGLGKKAHPRRGFFSSNGFVRGEGCPLDDFIKKSNNILFEGAEDYGWLPFICKLDDKDEVDDQEMWVKANPSLPYFKKLRLEIRKEYREWKEAPSKSPSFLTKRMGIYDGILEFVVTKYENIKYTNRPLPDLRKWKCVAGIDFSKTNDWVSATLHFRKGDLRYDINHSWICASDNNVDLPLIKAPLEEWEEMGLITFVNDKSINPRVIASWLQEQSQFYRIQKIAIDSYRYIILSDALNQAGFGEKMIFEVRPSNIMKIQPVIDMCFSNQYFVWGNNPTLRWAVNNTKLVPAKKELGGNYGNFVYGKFAYRSRKTDPFMSLVAAMCVEEELGSGTRERLPKSITIVF